MAVTHRLHRRHRARHRLLRHERLLDQHQPDRSGGRAAAVPARQRRGIAAKLRESIPNPFFGVAAAGEFGTSPTIQRGQLLRPFPEFGDVLMHETTEGSKRQYHAVRLHARQAAERRPELVGRPLQLHVEPDEGQPVRARAIPTRGATATPQNNYDLDAEYGTSIYDSPHRIILAPIVQLPESRRARRALKYALAGGWNASAIVELVSGSPLNAVLSAGASDANLGLFGGRQRPNLIGDPNTSGSDDDRVVVGRSTRTRGTSTRRRSRTPALDSSATRRGPIDDAR